MNYYVYILRCSDASYYVGLTNDLKKRLVEHNTSLIKNYTRQRKPLKLVWYSIFQNIITAISVEKQIKGWRREKKEALINHREEQLPRLSKRYT